MIKDEIIQYLSTHKDFFRQNYHLQSIGLFGSYARNEQTENSDIDLIYSLVENEKISYLDLFEMEEMLQNRFNKKVDLVNLKYMNPVVWYKAKNDVIYV